MAKRFVFCLLGFWVALGQPLLQGADDLAFSPGKWAVEPDTDPDEVQTTPALTAVNSANPSRRNSEEETPRLVPLSCASQFVSLKHVFAPLPPSARSPKEWATLWLAEYEATSNVSKLQDEIAALMSLIAETEDDAALNGILTQIVASLRSDKVSPILRSLTKSIAGSIQIDLDQLTAADAPNLEACSQTSGHFGAPKSTEISEDEESLVLEGLHFILESAQTLALEELRKAAPRKKHLAPRRTGSSEPWYRSPRTPGLSPDFDGGWKGTPDGYERPKRAPRDEEIAAGVKFPTPMPGETTLLDFDPTR